MEKQHTHFIAQTGPKPVAHVAASCLVDKKPAKLLLNGGVGRGAGVFGVRPASILGGKALRIQFGPQTTDDILQLPETLQQARISCTSWFLGSSSGARREDTLVAGTVAVGTGTLAITFHLAVAAG